MEELALEMEGLTSNKSIDLHAIPHMKIAVMPGISYLDPSLMIDCLGEGSDFRKDLSTDNVIEEFSKPILDEAVSQVLAEKPDLLLIPGELTFNGEKISHEGLAGILRDISEQGIKVFVIPGNKDILNPEAKAYNGNGSAPTSTITAEEFETLYSDFGFNHAISRDPNSMSYLTQAFNKVWILGIDARIYPITSSGRIKPETMEWIKYWLANAQKNNITMIPLCHHSVIEQWSEMAIYGPAYVIKDHETVENALTDAGLRIIFTASSNDIVMNTKGENVLYNISTGLLLSPPFPFRIITMDPNFMQVETRYIKTINATIPGGGDFLDYSNTYYEQNMTRYFTAIFVNSYKLPLGDVSSPGTAAYYAPHFAKGLAAFYAGDEEFPPEEEEFSEEWPEPFKHIFKNLYTDLPPSDGQYIVEMRKKLKE